MRLEGILAWVVGVDIVKGESVCPFLDRVV